jgi:hypothetical protein
MMEVEPGSWYYLLEETNAPKNAWDWREIASAYGPFVTSDLALEHLHENHANPGGFWRLPYEAGKTLDEVLKTKIAEAVIPLARLDGRLF